MIAGLIHPARRRNSACLREDYWTFIIKAHLQKGSAIRRRQISHCYALPAIELNTLESDRRSRRILRPNSECTSATTCSEHADSSINPDSKYLARSSALYRRPRPSVRPTQKTSAESGSQNVPKTNSTKKGAASKSKNMPYQL